MGGRLLPLQLLLLGILVLVSSSPYRRSDRSRQEKVVILAPPSLRFIPGQEPVVEPIEHQPNDYNLLEGSGFGVGVNYDDDDYDYDDYMDGSDRSRPGEAVNPALPSLRIIPAPEPVVEPIEHQPNDYNLLEGSGFVAGNSYDDDGRNVVKPAAVELSRAPCTVPSTVSGGRLTNPALSNTIVAHGTYVEVECDDEDAWVPDQECWNGTFFGLECIVPGAGGQPGAEPPLSDDVVEDNTGVHHVDVDVAIDLPWYEG